MTLNWSSICFLTFIWWYFSVCINQVISARKGEFETGYEKGGQTREHVQLAKTLGVSKLLVVVNKMDDPTVNWSKERSSHSHLASNCTSSLRVFVTIITDFLFLCPRYDEIESKMIPFLKQSGYNVKKGTLKLYFWLIVLSCFTYDAWPQCEYQILYKCDTVISCSLRNIRCDTIHLYYIYERSSQNTVNIFL